MLESYHKLQQKPKTVPQFKMHFSSWFSLAYRRKPLTTLWKTTTSDYKNVCQSNDEVYLPLRQYNTVQVAQLSQRDRAAGGLVMAKSGRLELGDNIYGQYKSIFNHCDIFGQQRNGNRRKTQNKGYYAIQGHPRSSRVIEVGTNRKPVCDFLLVINSNYNPISYRFGDIAANCSNFGHCAFLSRPLGGLETRYDVHLGLIGKCVVDLLLVLIKLFR